MALGYFPTKIIKKVESKETLTSCLIPCLLVVNTRQLDVLVTAVVVVRLGIKVTRPLNGPFYFVDFDIIFSHDNTSKVVFKEDFVCPYRIILGSQLTGFPLTGSIFCLLNIINRWGVVFYCVVVSECNRWITNKFVIIIIIIIQDLCSNASLTVLTRGWVSVTNNNNVFIVILFHFFFISSNIGILSGQNIMCLTWQKSKHVIISIYFATLMPVACSVLCLPLLFALIFSLLFPCHEMDSSLSYYTYISLSLLMLKILEIAFCSF